MGEVFKKGPINSRLGILMQIPIWLLAIVGVYNFIKVFCYSLTDCDFLTTPTFVGLENYFKVIKSDMARACIGNTVLLVFCVAALLLFTAVLPAIFTARLKLPFGLCVMGAFLVIRLLIQLPSFLPHFFSDYSYGALNSSLLFNSIIDKPVAFTHSHAMLIAIIVSWLYCLAPVFSITYIAARMKHSFLGTALAVCATPLLIYSSGSFIANIAGMPTKDYAADWIYTLFNDYLTVRFEAGAAYAVLSLGIIMLIWWCAAACAIMFGLWAIFRRFKSDSVVLKIFGYISLLPSLLLFFLVSKFALNYLMKAFMPLDELLIFSNHSIPRRPTLSNFETLLNLFDSNIPTYAILFNSLFVIPLIVIIVCLYFAASSGAGFGTFNAFKNQKLLLLCFIPLLFLADYTMLSKLELLDTYYVYLFEFLSSFEFLIAVFLVYLTSKLVFCGCKIRASSIILGIAFILSSFCAIGTIRGLWYNSNAIYSQGIQTWKYMSGWFVNSGIARVGVAAANDMLMLLATLAAVIVPLILLLVLYILHLKNAKQAAWN